MKTEIRRYDSNGPYYVRDRVKMYVVPGRYVPRNSSFVVEVQPESSERWEIWSYAESHTEALRDTQNLPDEYAKRYRFRRIVCG